MHGHVILDLVFGLLEILHDSWLYLLLLKREGTFDCRGSFGWVWHCLIEQSGVAYGHPFLFDRCVFEDAWGGLAEFDLLAAHFLDFGRILEWVLEVHLWLTGFFRFFWDPFIWVNRILHHTFLHNWLKATPQPYQTRLWLYLSHAFPLFKRWFPVLVHPQQTNLPVIDRLPSCPQIFARLWLFKRRVVMP